MKLIDLAGRRFHHLIVLYRAGSNRQGSVTWLCRCDCGKEKVYSNSHLTRKISPVKSCGCQAHKSGPRHSQWTGYGEISGNWWFNHVARERTQTKRAKIPVEITIKYAWELFLKQNKKCALSGVPLSLELTLKYNDASIDRIDNSKGYVPGNVQWVHKNINFMKRTYSQKYFIEMCKKVAEENLRKGKNNEIS